MPLPPQIVKALMDISTGRTAVPIILPPTPAQMTAEVGMSPNTIIAPYQPTSTAQPGDKYPGYIGPFKGEKQAGEEMDSRMLQKQLIDSDPDVTAEEMTPVPADKILQNHRTIPSTRDEPEEVAL